MTKDCFDWIHSGHCWRYQEHPFRPHLQVRNVPPSVFTISHFAAPFVWLQHLFTFPSGEQVGSTTFTRGSTMAREASPVSTVLTHACKSLPSTAPLNRVITLGESTVEVSSKNRQTIPPRTGKLLNATVSGKVIVKKQADAAFSYKIHLLIKSTT